MVDRDYAAPLRQERRISIWASITRSLHLSTDWDSAPLLTASLREQFPDLLRTGTTVQSSHLGSYTENTEQAGYHAAASNDPRQPPEIDFRVYLQTNATQTGQRDQQNTCRILSRQASLGETIRQQDEHDQNIGHAVPQLPLFRPPSPLRDEDRNGDSGPASAPSLKVTAPQAQQRSHTDHHRNARGQLNPVSQATPPASHVNSIRRRPVQSSLRNQVEREDVPDSNSSRNRCHRANAGIPAIFRPGNHNQVPVCLPISPIEPHPTSQSRSRSANAARHRNQVPLSSLRDPTAQTHLNSPSPTIVQLQAAIATTSQVAELEGNFHHDPPSLPFATRSDTARPDSINSHSTFTNPSQTSRPLGRLQANIEGLRQHVKNSLVDRRFWKEKVMHLRQSIKYRSRPLWDARDDRARVFWARVDVWILGDVSGCTCTVCVEKRGDDLAGATHLAHSVLVDNRPL
ncbi:hypothetical protein SVAN01_09123 [Stagonosporopsis vannaccii]|nr:hypothetical protein SVAN01_09123 [Stagonosporopsis vannaccii]